MSPIINTRAYSFSPSQIGRFSLFFLLLISLFACSDRYADVANLNSRGKVIVCFGDSITAGYGINRDRAFPALIARRMGMPVINAGRDGDTTDDALARLDRDVLAHNPRIVIVEFGGNDFRKKVAKETTFENLDRILGRITSRGSMVVLLGIRIGVLRDEYLPGYKDATKKHGGVLVSNFMSGILGNTKLTLEGIHPNEEGQRIIAERVMAELGPLLEEADRHLAEKP